MSIAVSDICTAGTRNQRLTSQAIIANPKVLSVPHIGLNHSGGMPVRLFRLAALKPRIRNVIQTRASSPVSGGGRRRPPLVTIRLISPTTTRNSRNHATRYRGGARSPDRYMM